MMVISIHVLREEDDQCQVSNFCAKHKFLSTSSARRTTASLYHEAQENTNFYPRPPRGGRPRELVKLSGLVVFLSTSSARRTTYF